VCDLAAHTDAPLDCMVKSRCRCPQASLGGDAKTLMFLNIAPEVSAAQESLCSLRFAAKVNACEIGTARRNVGGAK